MAHFQVNALEHAARSTSVWVSDIETDHARFGDVARALLPAALILAAATMLLLAIL